MSNIRGKSPQIFIMFQHQKQRKKYQEMFQHLVYQDQIIKQKEEIIVQQAGDINSLIKIAEQWKELAEHQQTEYRSLLKMIEELINY